MMAVGAMFTGVMCDTVVVETSMRYERTADKGQVQTKWVLHSVQPGTRRCDAILLPWICRSAAMDSRFCCS